MGNTHVSTLRGVATVAFMCGSMLHHQMFPDDTTTNVVSSDPTPSETQRDLLMLRAIKNKITGGNVREASKDNDVDKPRPYTDAEKLITQMEKDWVSEEDPNRMFITYTSAKGMTITVRVMSEPKPIKIPHPLDDTSVIAVWFKFDVKKGGRRFPFLMRTGHTTSLGLQAAAFGNVRGDLLADYAAKPYELTASDVNLFSGLYQSESDPDFGYFKERSGKKNAGLREAARKDALPGAAASSEEEPPLPGTDDAAPPMLTSPRHDGQDEQDEQQGFLGSGDQGDAESNPYAST